MLDKGHIQKGLVTMFALLLLSFPVRVDASDWGRSRQSKYDRHDRNDHYHRGYYHHKHYPVFYHRHHKSYPPYGKAVIRLPGGFIKVVIGNRDYYHCDGVYYRKHVDRYIVVAPPVEDHSFTVHIPGDRGVSTSVLLRKVDDGYLGPRGEFYPVFPTADELRFTYAPQKT